MHVLTNRDINDGSDPRVLYTFDYLGQRDYPNAAACLKALQSLCGQGNDQHPPICLRGDKKWTVSSTIVALRQPLTRSTYLHAQGPPDVTLYDDYSAMLQSVLARAIAT